MPATHIAARVVAFSTTQSPYPASFDNSPWLYGGALAALLSIGVLASVTAAWMMRDIWRDRWLDHPASLAFGFRGIIALVSVTAVVRCMPEVLYMTLYGEVTGAVMAQILAMKRSADILALPLVITWMTWLVIVYPYCMIELRSMRARTTHSLNVLGIWPRLARPFAILVIVIGISALMAIAKGNMGH